MAGDGMDRLPPSNLHARLDCLHGRASSNIKVNLRDIHNGAISTGEPASPLRFGARPHLQRLQQSATPPPEASWQNSFESFFRPHPREPESPRRTGLEPTSSSVARA